MRKAPDPRPYGAKQPAPSGTRGQAGWNEEHEDDDADFGALSAVGVTEGPKDHVNRRILQTTVSGMHIELGLRTKL